MKALRRKKIRPKLKKKIELPSSNISKSDFSLSLSLSLSPTRLTNPTYQTLSLSGSATETTAHHWRAWVGFRDVFEKTHSREVECEGAHYNQVYPQATQIRRIHHFTQKGSLRWEEKQALEERCEVKRLNFVWFCVIPTYWFYGVWFYRWEGEEDQRALHFCPGQISTLQAPLWSHYSEVSLNSLLYFCILGFLVGLESGTTETHPCNWAAKILGLSELKLQFQSSVLFRAFSKLKLRWTIEHKRKNFSRLQVF